MQNISLPAIRYCNQVGAAKTMTAEHLHTLLPEEAIFGFLRLVSVANDNGACFQADEWSLVVNVATPDWHRPVAIAWLDSPHSNDHTWGKAGTFTFGRGGGIFDRDRLPTSHLERALMRWTSHIATLNYSTPRWQQNLNRSWSISYAEAAEHIEGLCDLLAAGIRYLRTFDDSELPPLNRRPDPEQTLRVGLFDISRLIYEAFVADDGEAQSLEYRIRRLQLIIDRVRPICTTQDLDAESIVTEAIAAFLENTSTELDSDMRIAGELASILYALCEAYEQAETGDAVKTTLLRDYFPPIS